MPLFPPPESASISLAFHAEHAWTHRDAVRSVLAGGGHRCNRCSVRIPGWMEVDHADGNHGNWREGNLRPICHFCHLQAHPAQALDDDATLRLIWWPDIRQSAVTGLAWAMIWLQGACHEADEADYASRSDGRLSAHSLKRLRESLIAEITRLEDLAAEITGSASAAALLNVANRAGREPASWMHLRWWPGAASGTAELKRWVPGSGLEGLGTSEAAAVLFRQEMTPAEMLGHLEVAVQRLAEASDSERS